jgi:hypothetical protein
MPVKRPEVSTNTARRKISANPIANMTRRRIIIPVLGAVLEVDEERYGGEDIRRLSDSVDLPLLPQAAA